MGSAAATAQNIGFASVTYSYQSLDLTVKRALIQMVDFLIEFSEIRRRDRNTEVVTGGSGHRIDDILETLVIFTRSWNGG